MFSNIASNFIRVGNPVQGESNDPPVLSRYDQDVVVLSTLGSEIRTNFPHIWNSIGPVLANAVQTLIAHKLGESPPDPDYEWHDHDQSYKPVYRARDLVKWLAVWLENDNVAEASVRDPLLDTIQKWLNDTEDPEDILDRLLRVRSTYVKPETPPITYSLGILDLPSELVVDIVQLALHDDPHIVTTLSHTNSAFRAFALYTPVLWTSIDIMFHEKRISAHLERSRSAPLRIQASLTFLTMTRNQGLTKLSTFGKMIRPHAARIASLEMRYTNSIWGGYALTYLAMLGELPNLDEFDFGMVIHQSFQGDERLQASCKPRRIRLQAFGIKTFCELYSEKVVSLTVTECRERGPTDWEEALRLMPSLQTLEISDFKIGDPGENAGFGTKLAPISLPHLQTLLLTRVPKAVLLCLLKALRTPTLASTTIAFLEPDGLRGYSSSAPKVKPEPTHGSSDAVLLPFVTANPQLQELDLHNCCMTPDMWTAVFAQLPNLHKLRIASSDVTTESLMSLAALPGTTPVLPSLTHLTLDNESLDTESRLNFFFITETIRTRQTLAQQQQESDERVGEAQIHPLESVVLRGWNDVQIPTTDGSTELELSQLGELYGSLYTETFRETSDDGEATDGEWESLSEVSWASGD
ncbi:hypothetical protein FRC01_001927 [Tulasnella sp. 417]|nr:hypothetical protein FRC01_001927 [Tulasnella sp. 417]